MYNVTMRWTAESVRRACVRNNLYTLGSNNQYDNILMYVTSVGYPTYDDVLFAAKNILSHSEYQSLSNILYILHNDAIYYVVTDDDGSDDF